jgi:hypothetical protein
MRDVRRIMLMALALAAACRSTPRVCPAGFSTDGKPQPGGEVWCRASGPTRARWIQLHPGTFERKQMCPFVEGRANGRFETWHRNGTGYVAGDYRDGQKIGRWIQSDPTGFRVAEGDYRDGQLIAGAPVGVAGHCEDLKP